MALALVPIDELENAFRTNFGRSSIVDETVDRVLRSVLDDKGEMDLVECL